MVTTIDDPGREWKGGGYNTAAVLTHSGQFDEKCFSLLMPGSIHILVTELSSQVVYHSLKTTTDAVSYLAELFWRIVLPLLAKSQIVLRQKFIGVNGLFAYTIDKVIKINF